MTSKKWALLLFILLSFQLCCYSQSGSLSEQIMTEVKELQNLKESYSQVELQLQESEQNLENAEKSLAQMNEDLMVLSKDLAQSQKKSRFWKNFAITGISVSLVGGIITGLCIGLSQ